MRAMSADEPKPGRRALVVAGACAVAAAAAVPAAAFVVAPLGVRSTGGKWVRTVRLDKLVPGVPKRVAIVADRHDAWTLERSVELGSVWLVRHGDQVNALSSVCPHLGCSVNAVPEDGFSCPCHTSSFDPEGKRTGGPSPRDMDSLATRMVDGFVEVDFKRFRIGVSEKVET
jgi:menaquinol-cytochrome c reductase iron-sulfur subunit